MFTNLSTAFGIKLIKNASSWTHLKKMQVNTKISNHVNYSRLKVESFKDNILHYLLRSLILKRYPYSFRLVHVASTA